MVHLSRKRIKGKTYLYAVKSVRMPGGGVRKLSKLVKTPADARKPELQAFFREKEVEAFSQQARKRFSSFKLPDADALRKIEEMRLEYKRILASLSPAQLQDLFDRFTVNFTYESNALEGNSLTLKDVAIVIHENATIAGKDLREVYETRNSREVVDLILKRRFKVCERDVLRMHAMLVKDMGIAADYKRFPNYLHGRQVATTPPEDVPDSMRALFVWFEKNKCSMHPLQLAARLHARFEEIHPFEDGNGRVGRFLANVVLVNAGYPPLIIRKTQRISYLNTLEDFDNGRPQTIERFFFERLKETHEKFFKVYVKYLER